MNNKSEMIATASVLMAICSAPAIAGPAEATFTFSYGTGTSGSLLLDLKTTTVAGEFLVDGVSGTFTGLGPYGISPYTATVTSLYTGSYTGGRTTDNLLYSPAIFGLPVDTNGIGFVDSAGFTNVIVELNDPPYYGPLLTITSSGGFGTLDDPVVTIYPDGIPVPEPGAFELLGGAMAMLIGAKKLRTRGDALREA